jgi:hypothetical protein
MRQTGCLHCRHCASRVVVTAGVPCSDLLLSPAWLEQKMKWHGAVEVVADFNAAAGADAEFAATYKLLQQAFRMAEAPAAAQAHAGTLAAQMLGRTQAVAALTVGVVDEAFREWWFEQARRASARLRHVHSCCCTCNDMELPI